MDVSIKKVKGALLFLGMILAAMIFWNFIVRNFAVNHPDNPAAQALAQLV